MKRTELNSATLGQLVEMAKAGGMDRISAVQPGRCGRRLGYGVVMIGKAAIYDLGNKLLGMIPKDHPDPANFLTINLDSSLTLIFKWLEGQTCKWGWIKFEIEGRPVVAIFVLEPLADHAMALVLTLNGCPTFE